MVKIYIQTNITNTQVLLIFHEIRTIPCSAPGEEVFNQLLGDTVTHVLTDSLQTVHTVAYKCVTVRNVSK